MSNPFKIFGSWLGITIVLLALLVVMGGRVSIIPIFTWLFILDAIGQCSGEFCGNSPLWASMSAVIIGIVVWIVAPFLIGWGVHSLIRRLRKRIKNRLR